MQSISFKTGSVKFKFTISRCTIVLYIKLTNIFYWPKRLIVKFRMLIAFPKLLHDIYLSEEYYGENVLHMGCVAEDASLVKWLLDIGSDIHR